MFRLFMKSNKFFYYPIIYFLKTRISSLFKLVSWGFIYVVPTFYISISLRDGLNLHNVLSYLLQFIIIYNFYEIGYIENDNETTKKEINPTERLSVVEKQYYETYKANIFSFRIVVGLIFLLLLGYIENFSCSFLAFAVAAFAILVIYLFYNRVRNRITLFLHFMLVTLRFLAFLLLAYVDLKLSVYISLLLVYPVINLIERASNPKFNIGTLQIITFSEKNLALFRMIYYMLFFFLLLTSYGSGGFNQEWILLLFLFFFLYRLLGFIFILKTDNK